MKVVFLQNLAGIAEREDIKEVADGYALNFLLPRHLAVRATSESLVARAARVHHSTQTTQAQANVQQLLASELKGKSVTVPAKAATTGTLYAAITPESIVRAVGEQLKIVLQPGQVLPTDHLKTVGDHQVRLMLGSNLGVSITVHITPLV